MDIKDMDIKDMDIKDMDIKDMDIKDIQELNLFDIYADAIRYITIFLNFIDTFNFAKTNKLLYRIIISDPQFICIKLIFAAVKYDYLSYINGVNIMKTSRYFYYKCTGTDGFLFHDNDDSDDMDDDFDNIDYKDYYRKIQNDPVIIYPKYFRESHCFEYYKEKYFREYHYQGEYYYVNLHTLIQYYRNTGNVKYKFDMDDLGLSLDRYLCFENTEFAKKLKFIVSNYLYYISFGLYFEYNNIEGKLVKSIFNGMELHIIHDNTIHKFTITGTKLMLQKQLQLTDLQADLFFKFAMIYSAE